MSKKLFERARGSWKSLAVASLVTLFMFSVVFASCSRRAPASPARSNTPKKARVVKTSVQVPTKNLTQFIEKTNQDSQTHYQAAATTWRSYIHVLRDENLLANFVEELVSLEAKASIVGDLASASSGTHERAADSFRRCFLDERELVADMQSYAENFQAFLTTQDLALIEEAGFLADSTTHSPIEVDKAVWLGAFEPLFTHAVTVAEEDALRGVATFAGANLAGDGVKGVARYIGIDQTEEGSFCDFLTGLVVDVAVGTAIDAMTDPREGIISQQQTILAQVEHELLDGERGLLTVLKKMTDEHIARRQQMLTSYGANQ